MNDAVGSVWTKGICKFVYCFLFKAKENNEYTHSSCMTHTYTVVYNIYAHTHSHIHATCTCTLYMLQVVDDKPLMF